MGLDRRIAIHVYGINLQKYGLSASYTTAKNSTTHPTTNHSAGPNSRGERIHRFFSSVSIASPPQKNRFLICSIPISPQKKTPDKICLGFSFELRIGYTNALSIVPSGLQHKVLQDFCSSTSGARDSYLELENHYSTLRRE